MTPLETLPVQLAALAAAVWLWVAAGRQLLKHTHPADFTPTLAPSLLAGMGLWVVVWLLLVPLGGGHTLVAAAVFVLVTFVLAVPTLRDWARAKEHESHLVTLLLLQTAMLLPWILALPLVRPGLVADFTMLNLLQDWSLLGRWPLPGQEAGLLPPVYPALTWVPLLLPLAVVKTPTVVLPVAFNLLGVAVMAGWVGRVATLPLRWSNAMWVATTSLAVMLLALPLWWPESWVEPLSLWPLLALGVALAPLSWPKALPLGWSGLPYGLALVMLVGWHPLGLALVPLVALAWLVMAVRRHQVGMMTVLGISLLVCVPWMVGAVLLQLGLMPELTACLAQGLNGKVVACMARVNWSWLPWDLVARGIALALVPLALVVMAYARRWYAASWLARMAYRRPWSMGLVLAVPVVAMALAVAPWIRPPAPPIVAHALTVAADMRSKGLPGEAKVMVQGVPDVARLALARQLQLPAGQPAMLPDGLPMEQVQGTALAAGAKYLWQGPLAAREMMGVSSTLDATVLYEVTPDALLVRGLYPLPASD